METLFEEIRQDLATHSVLLYMKGTRTMPLCGFSAKVVSALNKHGISYETRNILENEELREGMKIFSEWPTFPQLYVKGEMVGGCDIVCEMDATGELKELFIRNELV